STHEDPDARKQQQAELERRASGPQRRYAWDFDESYDIFVAENAARGEGTAAPVPINLTRSRGYDAEGAHSPDGTSIVLASTRHAYAESLPDAETQQLAADPSRFVDVYVMDADGGNPRRLTTTPGYDGGPFFSPDGTRIVWRRFSLDGSTAEIFTMRADGG